MASREGWFWFSCGQKQFVNGKVEAEEAKVQICLVKQIGVKAYYYQALQSVKICT